jgi:hypothetical protein
MGGFGNSLEEEKVAALKAIQLSLFIIQRDFHRFVNRGRNTELCLEIPNQQGEIYMGQPVTLTVGAGAVQAQVQEFLNASPEPDTGPIAFSSDTPSVATVDPVSGLVTPVAPGTANITATDSTNVPALSDTVAVTVVAAPPPPPTQNTSLTLTVPTN